MEIIELAAWLQTKAAVREMNRQIEAFAADRWNRVGDVPRNFQRVQIVQMRIAEELRALDDQDLGDELAQWVLQPGLTAKFIQTYVVLSDPGSMKAAIPPMLDHVAAGVRDAFARSLGLDG